MRKSLTILIVIFNIILLTATGCHRQTDEIKIQDDSSPSQELKTETPLEETEANEAIVPVILFDMPKLTVEVENTPVPFTYDGLFTVFSSEGYSTEFTFNSENLNEEGSILTDTPTITFDISPTKIIQQTLLNETLIAEQELADYKLMLPLDEESYLIKLICQWDDDAFYGSMTYTLKLQMDLPVEFQITTDEIYPGDLIIIKADYVAATDTLAAESTLFDNVTFYPYEESYAALIPTNCYDLPSDYSITLKAMNAEGSVIAQEDYMIKLLEKEFEVQYLTATTSMTALNTADNAAHDQVYFDESKKSPIP